MTASPSSGRAEVVAARQRRRMAGSVTLELAMALPVLALVLLAVLQMLGVLTDLLAVQEAARSAARVATTTRDDGDVLAAVEDVLGTDRTILVDVTPRRSAGADVTVTVSLTSRLGPLRPVLVGSATLRGEPILGG